MERLDPRWLLAAIVLLSLSSIVACAVLILTGHESHVTTVSSLTMLVVLPLVSLKVFLIHSLAGRSRR